MRVLIADDEPLFGDALEVMLSADGRIEVAPKDQIADDLVEAILVAGAGDGPG